VNNTGIKQTGWCSVSSHPTSNTGFPLNQILTDFIYCKPFMGMKITEEPHKK